MMPMNKNAATAVIISFLIVSVGVASLVSLAEANPIRIVSGVPRIQLTSPQPMLYHENAVTLSFHGNNVDWGTVEYSKIKYWLDGELKGTLDTALEPTETFSVDLTGLEDGKHIVEVTATVTVKSLTVFYGGITADVLWSPSTPTSSGQLNFTLDVNPPSIVIISLQNRAFETVDVPLNFTVNEPVSSLSYSLDGNGNVTFTNVVMAHIYGKDNYYFILTGLEDGSHSLKIYAKDTAGYTGESETYYFTVNTQPTPTPSPSPSPILSPSQEPTMEPTLEPIQTASPTPIGEPIIVAYTPQIVVATVALIAVVAVGALVYFKRRKP